MKDIYAKKEFETKNEHTEKKKIHLKNQRLLAVNKEKLLVSIFCDVIRYVNK